MKTEAPEEKQKAPTDEHFIGHYEEAPGYMKDNKHITHGYRIGFNTPKKILRSLFMVHNESVNIWSHFVPALLIFCLIFYLIVFVGPATIINEYNIGKEKLSQGITSYSEAINNFTFYIDMSELKTKTESEIEEFKQSIVNSFSNFEEGFTSWKTSAEKKLINFQHHVENSLIHPIDEFELLKHDFEKIIIPSIVSNVMDRIDSEYLKNIAEKLKRIQDELDSEKYDYIESPSNNQNIPNPHLVSRWPVFVFLFSAVICLMCSTIFHLFYPMSGKSYQVFSRMDYAGINVLISGSSFPALYYGMYCNFNLVIFYLTIICFLGLSLFILSLFEYLHRPENFRLKSLAYGGFGVSLAIPLSHAVINEVLFQNYGDMFSMKESIGYYILCGFFYLFGLYIYTNRCPERHHPGRFNVCGNSHQIWHGFVVLGILSTYGGALINLETRKIHSCPLEL